MMSRMLNQDRIWSLASVPVAACAAFSAQWNWTSNRWAVAYVGIMAVFVPSLTQFARYWSGRASNPPNRNLLNVPAAGLLIGLVFLQQVARDSPEYFMGLIVAIIAVGHLIGAFLERRLFRTEQWAGVLGATCGLLGLAGATNLSAGESLKVGFLYFVYGFGIATATRIRTSSTIPASTE